MKPWSREAWRSRADQRTPRSGSCLASGNVPLTQLSTSKAGSATPTLKEEEEIAGFFLLSFFLSLRRRERVESESRDLGREREREIRRKQTSGSTAPSSEMKQTPEERHWRLCGWVGET
jgi:hypothetical protein